jgi:hypothetical protein
MEVDHLEEATKSKSHFNGAIPIKRARTELASTGPDAAQLRRRREAGKQYGRGRKIPGRILQCQTRSWETWILTSNSEGYPRQEAPG